MPISEVYTGSTSISTTEISLSSGTSSIQMLNDPGVFQVFIDLSNVINGSPYEFKVYEKVRDFDIPGILFRTRFIGPQYPPIWVSTPFILLHAWDMTLVRIGGANNVTINWSIRKVV